jgi:hypothetical protein
VATELERFRDHCRRMAESTPSTRVKANWHGGREDVTVAVGEMSDADRMLWARMAAEASAYLAHDPDVVAAEPAPDDVPLF